MDRQGLGQLTAVDGGDLDRALALYVELLPVVDAIMNHAPGVMTAKAALQSAGLIPERTVRPPLLAATDDETARLETALSAVRAGS